MFDRNDVIASVRSSLQHLGYVIEDRSVHGADIVARLNDARVCVVVTGETTSKKTAREGEAFRPDQVRDHVANAVYKALKLNEAKGEGGVVALAFPRNADHEGRVAPIALSFLKLGIGLIWINADGTVDTSAAPLPK